jgi:DNA-binding transcriptional MocR family regulator
VIFLSSFSKTVAPGIRTGYVILPPELVPEIEALVLEHYVSPAIFVEAALHDFVTSGRYEPNLERVREGLRIRRDAMMKALERELGETASWSHPEGGYFLWLDLPAGVRGEDLLTSAGEEDVTFIKGADFFFYGGGEEAARLAFSFATAAEIDEGIGRLGRLAREAAAVAA